MKAINTINPKLISDALNKCFVEYDPNWSINYGNDSHVNGFKYHIERIAGLKLDFHLETVGAKYGYRLNLVEIVDDKKFMMFQIKYS